MYWENTEKDTCPQELYKPIGTWKSVTHIMIVSKRCVKFIIKSKFSENNNRSSKTNGIKRARRSKEIFMEEREM